MSEIEIKVPRWAYSGWRYQLGPDDWQESGLVQPTAAARSKIQRWAMRRIRIWALITVAFASISQLAAYLHWGDVIGWIATGAAVLSLTRTASWAGWRRGWSER